jgi:hypothetical protein
MTSSKIVSEINESKRGRRRKKELDLRSGIPEGDERDCCYNCDHFRSAKKGGTCDKQSDFIKSPVTFKCKSHERINLSQCEICERFYRNLGSHVRSHGLSASQYKERYGINRHSSLACSATQRMVGESINEERREILRERMQNMDRPINSRRGYTLRAEGRINISTREMTPEHKQRIGDGNRGISKGKGVPKSDVHRKKIGTSLSKYLRYDVRRKIVRNDKGQIVTYQDKDIGNWER